MADYSVVDNGEVLKSGNYKVSGGTQFLTEGAGINLGFKGDMGLDHDKGLRAHAGFGRTDFSFGGFFKWMPMQDSGAGSAGKADAEVQPNLGGNAGILYLKDGEVSDMIIRVEPMVSKVVKIEEAIFTPYAVFPVGMRIRKSDDPAINEDTVIPIQMVVGTQLQIPQFDLLQFIAEIGIDLNKSPGYLFAGVVYYLDSSGENTGAIKSNKPGQSNDDEEE